MTRLGCCYTHIGRSAGLDLAGGAAAQIPQQIWQAPTKSIGDHPQKALEIRSTNWCHTHTDPVSETAQTRTCQECAAACAA